MELVDITPKDSIVPIYLEVLTEEEKLIRNIELAKIQEEQEQRESEIEAKSLARQSALAKLLELGLTQEEINSL